MSALLAGAQARCPADRGNPVHEDVWAAQRQPGLESIERAVAALTEVVNRRPIVNEAVPGWLGTAAENPHSYDSPDVSRIGVCARIRPATYDRRQMIHRQIGQRTTAGAWEFPIRLVPAAVELLPPRTGGGRRGESLKLLCRSAASQ